MDELFSKAVEAVESGRDAVDTGDANSAVNRAYCAMSNATRAYLKSIGLSVDGSHGSVVQGFGEHLVLTGKVDKSLGRTFNRLQEARSVADYQLTSVPAADAEFFVSTSEQFVDSIAAMLPASAVAAGWSRRMSRRERLVRTLAAAFCDVVAARGETVPAGFSDALVLHGSPDALSEMLANVDAMNDLDSFVRSHIPSFIR